MFNKNTATYRILFLLIIGFSEPLFAENSSQKFLMVTADNCVIADSAVSINTEEKSKSGLFIQFNTSELFSSLSDWKNQLHLSDGSHPSSNCIVFGAEAGWIINEFIQIGAGYEFFFTTKITAKEASGNQVNSNFFYGTVKASIPILSVPNLYLFGGLDIGRLKATEAVENFYYSGGSFDRTGKTTAYRVLSGAQYYLIENWSISAGTGYLFGKIKNVTLDNQTWPNFSLDLSGFLIRFAVNYHFNF